MAFSSSQASRVKYVVFLSLLLISKYKLVAAQTKSDNVSSTVPQIKHHVFVSFRGADIRRGLLSHLIKALSHNQIDAFVDHKLKRGDEILRSLVEAIEASFISLVVFSQDYASSCWCLEELVKILECRHKNGQIVIPVFYNVNPSDVRSQNGSYGKALAEHEKRYNLRVPIWRSALKESANLSGFHSSKFKDDAELIEEVVNSVLMKLNDVHLIKSKALIGIGKPIAHLNSLLQQESEDVVVIGIWGMGGIGKTTIAEELFNRQCSKYEGCCFLANVRVESRRHGIISLKKKLLSKLLDKDLKIDTANGLPKYVEERLGRMKVLIVLDDVNDSNQLEILVGDHDRFGSGSRIIITSRDKQVLAQEVDDIYEVGVLGFDNALKLFNVIAFKQNHLEMEYSELSKRLVNYAQGIPLVLKVLAHLLRGKGKEVWESQLEKLKKMPSGEVHDVMKLSYDDLDRKEQKIFLDLACFFNGLNLKVGYIKTLLKDHESDHSVVVGLERLKDKALITISEENMVSIHDIIQEMAWEIVRQESIEDPEHRSRLWDPDDIYDVLKYNKGTETIRSITAQLSAVRKLELSPRVFSKMSKLQFLDFHYNNNYSDCLELPQGLQPLATELRYLRWKNYPIKSLPEKFSAEKLVIFDLSYSRVEKLWHGVQDLGNLKFITVHASKFLKELPDFSKATNLEEVDISDCDRLTSVHPSILSLNKLEKLDISMCPSLTRLKSHTHLSSIRYLTLRGCKKLRKFSVTSENMMELDLRYTSIRALPSSIGRQSKLEILRLSNTYIESLPVSIRNLSRLRYLDISYCNELQTLSVLPPSLEKLHARNSISLQTVLFPSTVAEQLKEKRKKVELWNCLKLEEHSRMAIGLNAKINMMKFALEHGYVEGYDEGHDTKVTYVYPGSNVPEWLEYRTRENYVTIDLSTAPRSPLLGFILCFIIPMEPPSHLRLKINITISGDEDEEGKGNSIKLDVFRPLDVASDHVYVTYDLQCSRYLNSKAQNLPRFKIKIAEVLAFTESKRQGSPMRVVLKGFGVSPINASSYHNLIQSMELRDYQVNISISFNKWNWVLGSIVLCISFLWFVRMNLKRRKSKNQCE
ncbi:hypothetical protein RIF29_25720 [Crotalaria pallida]|uniref:TIR domain-containing protein n=1 Tax=Crotalaria pallida TaxID=3830 RepID=A0AAN9HXP1_CROPI